MNLKEIRFSIREGFEGGNGREKRNYNLKNNIKNKKNILILCTLQ